MAGLFSPVKATRGKMMTVGGGLIMTVGVTLCFLLLFGETTRTKVLCGRDENAGLEGVPGSLISLPKENEAVNRTALRIEYYRNNYDVRTGLRIAGTLGGFFLLVLLMLLYKSKSKKVSRDPSPMPMDLGILGSRAGQTPRSSIMNNSIMQERSSIGVIVPDSPTYMMNCNKYFNSPAVLLTAANSESSDEDFSTSGFIVDEGGGGGGRGDEDLLARAEGGRRRCCSGSQGRNLNQYYQHHQERKKSAINNCDCSSSSPTNKMKWLKQSIDIHVILPTPTISPSSSETFTRLNRMRREETEEEEEQENCCVDNRDCLSANEYEMSSLVPPTGSLCFLDNLKYVDDTSSENIPTRTSDLDDQDNDSRRSIGSDSVFACYDYEYCPMNSIAPPPPPPPLPPPPPPTQSQPSSTSSGAPPPLPPKQPQQQEKNTTASSSSPPSLSTNTTNNSTNARKRFADRTNNLVLRDSSRNSSFYDNEDEDECECRMTLTQAQVHHRDSYCSSELESVNDYLESHRRRSSSTQTTLSDLRQCLNNSYTGSHAGSNTSSRSQSRHSPNPFPHLSPYLNYNNAPSTSMTASNTTTTTTASTSTTVGGSSSNGSSTIPVVVPSTSRTLAPPAIPNNNNNNNPVLLRVEPLVNYNQSRKRSFDSLKSTYGLQCDHQVRK